MSTLVVRVLGPATLVGLFLTAFGAAPAHSQELQSGQVVPMFVDMCGELEPLVAAHRAVGPDRVRAFSVMALDELQSVLSTGESTNGSPAGKVTLADQWNRFDEELSATIDQIGTPGDDPDPGDQLILAEAHQLRLILQNETFFNYITSVVQQFGSQDTLRRGLLSENVSRLNISHCEVGSVFEAVEMPVAVFVRPVRRGAELETFIGRVARLLNYLSLSKIGCSFSPISVPANLLIGNGIRVSPANYDERLRLIEAIGTNNGSPANGLIQLGKQNISSVSFYWTGSEAVSLDWWIYGILFETLGCPG